MTDSAPNDRYRLAALHAFGILDTPAEPIFDRLTQFASSICEAPISTISLIDGTRQWFKSVFGLDLSETDRAISFCTHTIKGTAPMIVKDTWRDQRFRENPLVIGPPHIRFYAGVPLITPDGFAIGTLTVMDTKPRRLSKDKLVALKMLTEQVMTHIELREQHRALNRAVALRDEANHRLQEKMEQLREAHRIARLGNWELDPSAQLLRLSEECCDLFGVAGNNDTTIDFDDFLSLVHQDDAGAVREAARLAISGQTPLRIIHRVVRPDGEIRHIHQRGALKCRSDDSHVLSGTAQDITEQRQAQQELELLYTCISRLNDIVMITDAESLDEPGPRIVFVNRAFEEHTGYSLNEALGRAPRFLQGPKTQRAVLDRIHNALAHKDHVSAELINYTKDGREFWSEIDIDPVIAADGRVTHFVSIQRNITQRKAAEQQIEKLVFFDPLTQLPNRRLLMDRLNHALANACRNRRCGAILFIDLDNFKSLNDTLGHDKGDQLLIQVARRLERAVRKSNTVARIGGDEFVILLEDLRSEEWEAAARAEIVAEKALACFRDLFMIDGHEYHCTPSIGVAIFSKQQNDADDLLKRADLAMYQAKTSGRNAIRFFDHQMQTVVNSRVALDRDLRGSIQKDDFLLHFQPQVDELGNLIAAEALVRWKHPRLGLLYPTQFISLAEETGLIVQLGRKVLQLACKQLASWERQAEAPVRKVAVNISARQFHHPEFVSHVLGVLAEEGVNPSNVKLELTESAFIEHADATVMKMEELKSCGISFSLDDFGTGYSSLSYLKKLPLDEIKIDRAFIRDVLTDRGDAAIAQTIVSLCQILGFDVVAEGVETEGQWDFLVLQGCNKFQGNLISPPVPAGEL